MSSGKEHADQAEARLRASDWQRQQADRHADALDCAMHEAAMAQAHATLAVAKAVNSVRWWLDEFVDLNTDDNVAPYISEAAQAMRDIARTAESGAA